MGPYCALVLDLTDIQDGPGGKLCEQNYYRKTLKTFIFPLGIFKFYSNYVIVFLHIIRLFEAYETWRNAYDKEYKMEYKLRIYLHGKNIYKERNDSSQGDRFKESSLLTFKFQSILYLHLTL